MSLHREGLNVSISRARTARVEQCEAARTIRSRYGLKAALDYLVTEKLVNFAEAAVLHPDFARELPAFVADVRRIFTPQEVATHLAALERHQVVQPATDADWEDDLSYETPAMVAARSARFATIKQVLVAGQLGTS